MKFNNDNNNRRVYCFDLDGVLCDGLPFWEGEPSPKQETIDKLRKLYEDGNIIIIWTARQWEYAPVTVGWLVAHCVPFHGIQMAKGGADYYIDDKAISI
jgi:trehalose-6-phosphatase